MDAPGKLQPVATRHFVPRRRSVSARQAGFTLVELMVVIFIMAVIAALLLPSLNKAKTRSQAIACLNNLKQLQVAWHMYAHDHDDLLVPNNFATVFDKKSGHVLIAGESWAPGNARTDATTDNIRRGLLFPYASSIAIYRCPADDSVLETPSGVKLSQPRTRSYTMNASINSEVTGNSVPFFRKYSDIVNPPPFDVFVFLDTNEDAINDSHFALFPNTTSFNAEWLDMPSDRHGQGGNLSFADGHVERWNWYAPKVYRGPRQTIASKEDLKDMHRLQRGMKQ